MAKKSIRELMLRGTPRGGKWEIDRHGKLTNDEKATIEKALDNFLLSVCAMHDEIAKKSPQFAIPEREIVIAIRTLQSKVWDQ